MNAEAKALAHEAADAKSKGVSKKKTNRMEPASYSAFPLFSWQTALDKLKTFAKERVSKLKSSHEGDDDDMAKIIECEECIESMRYWKQYELRVRVRVSMN